MTGTKLAFVCFVAARNWVHQHVQDHADAKSPPECSRSQSTTTCESSYVLQSSTPVLLCTTKYYPLLVCTTKYYSSTSLYYKILFQYNILYYKVLLQYYFVLQILLQSSSVLQSTTPILLYTTKYYSNIALYYKVL